MEGLVVWSCLIILLQFHCVVCDDPLVDHDSINDERIKRYHENDCEKLRAKRELNKPMKTTAPIAQKPKSIPKPIIKQKLSTIERNEPKNVKIINHILEEIATVAHNHNQSKGIHKIRHLVDEIDKQSEIKRNESKLGKETLAEMDKIVKTLKKKEEKAVEKVVLTNQIANKTKSKELPDNNNSAHKPEKVLEIESTKKPACPSESKKTLQVKVNESKLRSKNSELGEENERFKKQDAKDEKFITIEEHTYEEESVNTPCKYTQPNTYNNWYTGQNYDSGFYTNNYDYNNNNYANCYPVQSYPSTYGENNNGNYYANYYAKPDLVKPVINQRNDYIRRRKTWLDRDTIIDVNDPNEYQVKTINEDKQEITSIHRPDFHRKYYSITQKQYSSDASKNQKMYYKDPYHCS